MAKGSKAQQEESDSLYASRKKIHMRSVKGNFANWRWFFVWFTQILYYGLPWLEWNERQAVLFNLAERKFYIFNWVFWPQDVIYLAILLIISAFGLFFFTAIAGRLWCGYTCPQTVYTEIFMWIEEKIEGDHVARRKLHEAPMSPHKAMLRTAKYAVWAIVALWTGFTFVAYFTPLDGLIDSFAAFDVGGWVLFWTLFYAAFTYIFAGVLREQVCFYMCPYARFQGVMFDPDTLVVTYDSERGDPRGSRKKGVDPKSIGKGDCVDCNICVQVCPTGIDIRDGLQYECIGCGACIDGCNDVMDRMGYERGLIRYSTENAVKQHWTRKDIIAHILRPRILVYAALLVAICSATLAALLLRPDMRVDIIRDRAALAREVEGGMIENVYRLQIMNMTELPREVVVDVSGIEGAQVVGSTLALLPAAGMESVSVNVRVPYDAVAPGVHEIAFEVTAEDLKVREQTTFIMPQ
ncbi:MAG: cytochrome c oxidase accessory protein CcoG [Pseudazoarcus pumilus]|nr:cytochrome c oxidase accessory protein CcoG [Pseudazoarcus pumilus]